MEAQKHQNMTRKQIREWGVTQTLKTDVDNHRKSKSEVKFESKIQNKKFTQYFDSQSWNEWDNVLNTANPFDLVSQTFDLFTLNH